MGTSSPALTQGFVMTPRTTLLGLGAAIVGLAVLTATAGTLLAVLGGVLLTVGAVVVVAAAALGVRAKDPVQAAAAEHARKVADGAAMKRSGEQGQWQRTTAGL